MEKRNSSQQRYSNWRKEHPVANAFILCGVIPGIMILTSVACNGNNNSGIHKCSDGLPPGPISGKCPDTKG